ncbi:glycosyltransferase, partial [Acinetobacter baumannii]
QSTEQFARLMAAADIHLLPQCAEIQDLALPSKIGAMLASGRPIIGMATPGTQVAIELNDCGIVIPPGDLAALTDALC